MMARRSLWPIRAEPEAPRAACERVAGECGRQAAAATAAHVAAAIAARRARECSSGLESRRVGLESRQAKLEQGIAEHAEFAKKLLQECQDMPIHERCKFGGAEGYDAKVRELEAIVIEVKCQRVLMEDIAICNATQHAERTV